MEDLQEKIRELEKEIAALPIGYISRKTINGTVRLYHQWTENGKKISKYLDDGTAEALAEKIELRREKQRKLKEMIAKLPKNERTRQARPALFQTSVLTSDLLRQFASRADGFKSRFCLKDINDYLYAKHESRVLILFGLRRTGKTTLIQQAIAGMTDEQFAHTAYVQVRSGDTLANVNQDFKQLQSLGYRYVFLDEATLLEDFIEGAALFSDIFAACGMKIVLSGTDSLGFRMSAHEQLYDRCRLVHTTFISYREFEQVLGIHGIDEYIRYGGTMSLGGIHYNERSTFSSARSTDEYVDSAIARNIQHSLEYYQDGGHFRHLYDLYEKNELTSAINRVIEDINHRFTMDVLTRDFVSHDLGLSARNLRQDRKDPTDILDFIDRETFTQKLKDALEIKNKSEQTVKLEDIHRIEIQEYLALLDLIVDIPVETLPVSKIQNQMTVVTQPGLRYSQAKELIRVLLLDAAFEELSAQERKRVIDRILNEIRGRMMEEIVLLGTMKAYPKKKVFKLSLDIGEFDMVLWDEEEATIELFEIKHSKQTAPEQVQHLTDEKKCADAAFRFGAITRKAVIYRGETKQRGDIEYINVEEYLSGLEKS